MAVRARRQAGNGLDAWPGYVDALSTLLMVIIFVLLVFVLSQAFMTVALTGRGNALDQANRELSALTEALSLERGKTASLQLSVSQLSKDLSARTAERDQMTRQLGDANLAVQAAMVANARMQAQVSAASGQADAAVRENEAAKARLAEMQRQLADLDRSVTADKATIQAKLADLAALAEQARALTALRDDLEKQAQAAAAAAMTEQQRRAAVEAQLSEEKKLGDSGRAQIALLNQQIDQLRAQLASVAAGLELAKQTGKDKDAQIANLGQKLNAALASKVEELQQYRSEFFGRLRNVLANRPGIQVVGDRFVFQSEVLFPLGSAEMTQAGTAQMTALAVTIKDIAQEISADVHWVLRVDGHTDPLPVKAGGVFASNWELSAARAITVVKLLIADGVPPNHLAATGFGEYQPFTAGESPEAYAKDRRIELRLTDR